MNTDNYKVYCICDNCNKNTEVRDKGYMPSGWYEMVVNLYETETRDPTNYWSVILCDECSKRDWVLTPENCHKLGLAYAMAAKSKLEDIELMAEQEKTSHK